MAVKHHVIKPYAHANSSYNDRVYVSSAAIVEGAPVIFSAGKVAEFTDTAVGPTLASELVGFALNSTSGANEDCLVAIAYPGRVFVGSLGTNIADAVSDDGLTALALANIGSLREMHKDATTLKWILGVTATTTAGAALIVALVDKITATTGDAPTFGSTGGGPGVAMTVSGKTTALGDPAGSNSGKALVQFCIPADRTIFANVSS
jgi:hypothetical protein